MDTFPMVAMPAQQDQAAEADDGLAHFFPAGDARYQRLAKLPRTYKHRLQHELTIAADEKRKHFLLEQAEKKLQDISARNKTNSHHHKKGAQSHKQRSGCGKAGFHLDDELGEDIEEYYESLESDSRGTSAFFGWGEAGHSSTGSAADQST